MTGKIHSFETFGSVDGPGVRFLVFLSGCNFRCKYCHNPDTWARPAALEMTADEVLAKALRYREYWGTEGGITVSGGEPLLQLEFLTELFEKAKAKGWDRDREKVRAFEEENKTWLPNYTLFMACKRYYKDAAWTEWKDKDLRLHKAETCG